jgi:hypothetical protein
VIRASRAKEEGSAGERRGIQRARIGYPRKGEERKCSLKFLAPPMSKPFPCCLALIALLGTACSEDKVIDPPSEEPVVVSDLAATRTSNRHVALCWTAPGSRGTEHPSRYDVRRSSNSIEESTWNEVRKARKSPTATTGPDSPTSGSSRSPVVRPGS